MMKNRNTQVNNLRNWQHERLIHLLVTLFFGLIFVMTEDLAIVFGNLWLSMIGGLLMLLLIPYIWHYFKLENKVQGMS